MLQQLPFQLFLWLPNNHHSNEKDTYASWKYVDSGKEAADLFIMNHAKRGDIVITQDIGLASTLLPKEIQTISPKGFLFEEKDIQTALDIRFLKAKARKRGMYGKDQNLSKWKIGYGSRRN
ncbi:DUF188 domain-containing protein [Bacillus sp. FJAT-29814]|uniref:DUF188 domain-containing protein n=1 Tax=Bacillus sp. FJAT-29814 TaxID=1729688 RepID=UPI000A9B824C|nr:DUF188 domain-containing protein [Bacillus sp. FJAT-29814]